MKSTIGQPVAPPGHVPLDAGLPVAPFSFARTRTTWWPAATSTVTAHCPQVSSGGRRQARRAAAPPSSAIRLASIPVCWRQATPPTRRVPAGTSSPSPARRCGGDLDRELLGPARSVMRRHVGEPGDLHVDDPFAAEVAVQARHDGAHREACPAGVPCRSWRSPASRRGYGRSGRQRGAAVQASSEVCTTSRPPRADRASASSSPAAPAPPGVAERVPQTGLETQFRVIQASVSWRSAGPVGELHHVLGLTVDEQPPLLRSTVGIAMAVWIR